ncbi:MAG: hypothetical protein ACTJHT_11465 [Sphingobacterium sp.]
MFKKIISNSPTPKRFQKLDAQNTKIRQRPKTGSFLQSRPLVSLILMLAAILGSLVYLIANRPSVSAVHHELHAPSETLAGPLSSGITGIISSASALGDIVKLQAELEVFLAKDSLTSQDSTAMEHALDHINELENKLASDQRSAAHHDSIN